jgi:hypothetical protein
MNFSKIITVWFCRLETLAFKQPRYLTICKGTAKNVSRRKLSAISACAEKCSTVQNNAELSIKSIMKRPAS